MRVFYFSLFIHNKKIGIIKYTIYKIYKYIFMENNKKYRIAVIHHNADMDGLLSGTIALKVMELLQSKTKYGSLFQYDIIGYNYGKNPDIDTWLNTNNIKYDYYQFIDVTPPINWISNNFESIIKGEMFIEIFDHHKPVFDEISKNLKLMKSQYFNYHFNLNNCGAHIYWNSLLIKNNWIYSLLNNIKTPINKIQSFFSNNELKDFNLSVKYYLKHEEFTKLITLVDSYDTWKWKNEKPENINALAINEYLFNYKTVLEYYNELFVNKINVQELIEKGNRFIYVKNCAVVNKKHIICDIYNVKIAIINDKANAYDIDYVKSIIYKAFNQELSGPNNNDEIEKYIGLKAILFYNNIDFQNNKINISLRSLDNDFNVDFFVKQITNGNGGGHSKASGGSLSLNDFQDILETAKFF